MNTDDDVDIIIRETTDIVRRLRDLSPEYERLKREGQAL